jgi:hypothetical protein
VSTVAPIPGPTVTEATRPIFDSLGEALVVSFSVGVLVVCIRMAWVFFRTAAFRGWDPSDDYAHFDTHEGPHSPDPDCFGCRQLFAGDLDESTPRDTFQAYPRDRE